MKVMGAICILSESDKGSRVERTWNLNGFELFR